jgi:hypothetical protein
MTAVSLSSLLLSLSTLEREDLWEVVERFETGRGTLVVDKSTILHIIRGRTTAVNHQQSTLTRIVDTESQLMDLIRWAFRSGKQLKSETDLMTGKPRIPFVLGFDQPIGFQNFDDDQPLLHLRLSTMRHGNKIWKLRNLVLEPCVRTGCHVIHGTKDRGANFDELLKSSWTPA